MYVHAYLLVPLPFIESMGEGEGNDKLDSSTRRGRIVSLALLMTGFSLLLVPFVLVIRFLGSICNLCVA